MQPNALLIRQNFIICKKWVLHTMTLAQNIVASSVLPITEILTIENHNLYYTFLHVAFRSQNLLEPTSDQTDSITN
jgi:hypothetical protein